MSLKKIKILAAALLLIATSLATALPAAAETQTDKQWMVTMQVGGRRDLSGFIRYRKQAADNYEAEWYTIGSVSWSSDNTEVLTVDVNGVATAHKVGIAKITASSWDNTGDKRLQTFFVSVRRENDSGDAVALEISEGKFLGLGALFHPGDDGSGAYGQVEWSSSNSSIASVDSSGLVTAKSVGQCTITAVHTLPDGSVETAKATVRVSSILLNNRNRSMEITLPAGRSLDLLQFYYPKYVSNPNITKQIRSSTTSQGIVSLKDNVVTAVGEGSCTVTLVYSDSMNGENIESQRFSIKVIG